MRLLKPTPVKARTPTPGSESDMCIMVPTPNPLPTPNSEKKRKTGKIAQNKYQVLTSADSFVHRSHTDAEK